jgi:hypothetical protein
LLDGGPGMEQYRQLVTPAKRKCEVREVQVDSGRRWHVRVPDRKDGSPTFYLWADRSLPVGMDEDKIMRGVLRGVDLELASPRSKMAPDYEAPLNAHEFEE